ncbi:Hermansky-Pudlak syndrome 3 protein-like isoform X1 [Mizuhopecten yessoensis]|uniref:Hermansky-Pudlak syndrome 3 protein-like isoform X1 n=1 Tax=Mizuhopecten yessoensis TaxID=6573 RepID=UPI000B45ED76|nr:Hermansky-Pudlak syndrome 3 protein-like isoform X1 [Mizuhopecten yessoensis]
MVKVYKCHNFKSQSVVPVDGEPVAVFSSKHRVFVATQQCVIEVFVLDEQDPSGSKYTKTNSFSTEAPIEQLLYNETGGYVATRECKVSRKQKFYSVKIYLNWNVCTEDSRPIAHVRLAGGNQSVKPSNKVPEWMDVIDIPCKYAVSSISTCSRTGNLAVASENGIYLYHLVEKTVPNSDNTFLDVVLFLQLDWSFTVDQITLCEDFVGVSSEKEIQIVRILYSDKSFGRLAIDDAETSRAARSVSTESFRIANRKTSSSIMNPLFLNDKDSSVVSQFSNVGSRSSSTPSPALSNSSVTKSIADSFSCILDDENFVQWKFEDIDLPRNELSGNKRQELFRDTKTVHLKGLTDLMCRDLLLADPPKITDLRASLKGGGHMTFGDVKVETLLYKRWNIQDVDGGWRHMQMVPTYLAKNERFSLADRTGTIPVHSSTFSDLVGVSVLISGDTSGFLYSLWPHNCLLTEYKYTKPAKQIWAEGELMYVLTDNGLETYTCRASASAVFSMEDYASPTKVFPSIKREVCLCGIHPFIGPRKLTVSDNHVILLAMMDSGARPDDNLWSLYALQKFSNSELYKEMIAFGSRYQQKNPDTYLSLLEEGHMILRSAMVTDLHGDCSGSPNSSSDLLQESAALLGEFYAMPRNMQWHLCLPYYLMSGLSLSDIVRQALQYKQHTKSTSAYCYGQGFLYYLNYVLFQDEEPFQLKEEEGDTVLDVCAEAVPDKLSRIILFSRLQTYTQEKTLSLLKHVLQQKYKPDEAKSGTDMLALSLLHLKSCDPESARLALAAVSQMELRQFCVNHHQLLHEDFQQLSPLSQLMRRHCPEVLIQCLIALHDIGTIPLDLAIKLLQGPSGYEEIHQNAHLKEYLELLINDEQRKYVFEDAVVLLCEIYIKCLVQWRPPCASLLVSPVSSAIGHLPKGDGHFGQRYAWLDHIPPLQGSKSIRQPCQYTITTHPTSARRSGATPCTQVKANISCSCFRCREDLLKLQSILCSPFTTLALVEKVMALLEEEIQGYDSLWMLCMLRLDHEKATKVVIDKYPVILADYGISIMQKDITKWKGFLNMMMATLQQQAEEPDQREPKYLEGLKGVFSWLASAMEPADFLNLLPGNGNVMFFLPFIATCYKKKQSRKLLSNIVTKGEHLKNVTS